MLHEVETTEIRLMHQSSQLSKPVPCTKQFPSRKVTTQRLQIREDFIDHKVLNISALTNLSIGSVSWLVIE